MMRKCFLRIKRVRATVRADKTKKKGISQNDCPPLVFGMKSNLPSLFPLSVDEQRYD